jgi:hypothetical protein
MRLLKLSKQNNSTDVLKRVFTRETPILTAALFIMMLMVVLAASLAYLFEHDLQPDKYENIPSSIYWATITLSSVGYGDISPVSSSGRVITIMMAMIGVGIFAIPSALLAASFSDEMRKDKNDLIERLFKRLKAGLPVHESDPFVSQEAIRLNLSAEQIKGIIDKVRYDHKVEEDLIKQPLEEIAANTDQSIEHFVKTISRLRQLGILLQQEPVDKRETFIQMLSPSETQLWQRIQS